MLRAVWEGVLRLAVFVGFGGAPAPDLLTGDLGEDAWVDDLASYDRSELFVVLCADVVRMRGPNVLDDRLETERAPLAAATGATRSVARTVETGIRQISCIFDSSSERSFALHSAGTRRSGTPALIRPARGRSSGRRRTNCDEADAQDAHAKFHIGRAASNLRRRIDDSREVPPYPG
jgi:hypothetical protein